MRHLADHSSHTVMKAISRMDKNEWPEDETGNPVFPMFWRLLKKLRRKKKTMITRFLSFCKRLKFSIIERVPGWD